jgi:hypothetical protein
MKPKLATKAVISTGRNLRRAPPSTASSVLPFERRLPVFEWSEIFYAC